MSKSLLHVVATADNFPPHRHRYPHSHPTTHEPYVPLHLSFSDYKTGLPPIGLLRPAVLQDLLTYPRHPPTNDLDPSTALADADGEALRSPWQSYSEGRPDADGVFELFTECVFFADWVLKGGKDGISKVIADVAGRWKRDGEFKECLDGWRDERYAVYASPSSSFFKKSDASDTPFSNHAFDCERSACAIFGFCTYGVHMTAYEGEGESMKIWVPRRSATKATWPGKLDNTVAGGIPSGMKPIDSLVKECDEEGSLPESLVRSRIKVVGACTYFHITEAGYLQPELEYIYDLPLPPRDSEEYVRPHPHDDEVESFELLSIPDLITALHSGDFKPNSGLILVDFLIRHGIVTPENERNYYDIVWRCHRRLGLAVPM